MDLDADGFERARARGDVVDAGAARQRPLALIVVLGLLLAGFNCLVFPVAQVVGPGRDAIVATVTVGIVAAQVGLVATWGVFSSAAFLRRVGISALIGLLLFGCFAFGILVVNSVVPIELASGIPMLLMVCPLVFFGAQMPLWGARIWLRWEIAARGQTPRGSYTVPTRIMDFVLGTAVGSVALALAKLAPHTLPDGQGQSPEAFMIPFAFLSAAAAVVSTVTLPPLIFFILGARHLATKLIGVSLWYASGLAILLGADFVARGGVSAGSLTFCLLLTGAFTSVTCFGLLLARGQGYRLRRGRLEREAAAREAPGTRCQPSGMACRNAEGARG